MQVFREGAGAGGSYGEGGGIDYMHPIVGVLWRSLISRTQRKGNIKQEPQRTNT